MPRASFTRCRRARTAQPLPPQSVTLFNASYNKDRFENTAWTINGRVGDLEGGLHRRVSRAQRQQVQDYTNYARGVYADYYQCHGRSTSATRARPATHRAPPGTRPSATRT